MATAPYVVCIPGASFMQTIAGPFPEAERDRARQIADTLLSEVLNDPDDSDSDLTYTVRDFEWDGVVELGRDNHLYGLPVARSWLETAPVGTVITAQLYGARPVRAVRVWDDGADDWMVDTDRAETAAWLAERGAVVARLSRVVEW